MYACMYMCVYRQLMAGGGQSDSVLNSPNYQLFIWWWHLLRKVSVKGIPTRTGMLLIECMWPRLHK